MTNRKILFLGGPKDGEVCHADVDHPGIFNVAHADFPRWERCATAYVPDTYGMVYRSTYYYREERANGGFGQFIGHYYVHESVADLSILQLLTLGYGRQRQRY